MPTSAPPFFPAAELADFAAERRRTFTFLRQWEYRGVRCELYRSDPMDAVPSALPPIITGYAGLPVDAALLPMLKTEVSVFGDVTYTSEKQGLACIGWDSFHVGMSQEDAVIEGANEDACAAETERMVDSALAVLEMAVTND